MSFSRLSGNYELVINKISLEAKNNIIPEIFQKKYKMVKSKNYTFLSVTRYDENKNVFSLVEAFAKNFKLLDAKLIIIGQGSLYKKIKQKISSKNLENKVQLLGYKTRKQLVWYYKSSDCFVLPSFKETFGLSLFEALMFKLNIITSNHSGYLELKKKNINLPSFDPHNISRLGKLMISAFKNKKKKKITTI